MLKKMGDKIRGFTIKQERYRCTCTVLYCTFIICGLFSLKVWIPLQLIVLLARFTEVDLVIILLLWSPGLESISVCNLHVLNNNLFMDMICKSSAFILIIDYFRDAMDAEDSGVSDLNKLLTCEYTQMCMRMAEAACIQVQYMLHFN